MERSKYRTQLYLDEEQYLFLKEEAARYGTSMAEVVRRLIEREMGGAEDPGQDDPIFQLAQRAIATGRGDGSLNHDRYIYRWKRGKVDYE